MHTNTTQQKNGQNIALLKETLRTAEETNQIAIDTNVELHGQGEKLQGMNGKLNKINTTLGKSQETAKEMNSFWYHVKNKIKRGLGMKMRWEKEEERYEEEEKKSSNGNVVKSEFKNRAEVEAKFNEMASSKEPYDQEDELADELLNKLKELKGHSKDMGSELDRQRSALQNLDGKMDQANTKTAKVNSILNKILRK